MPKPRGSQHTTLTETATTVVSVLERLPGIKMIAPGEIRTAGRRRSGSRLITTVYTTSGFELIITGQSVQNVAVHLIIPAHAPALIETLQSHKTLKNFTWKARTRKPGI